MNKPMNSAKRGASQRAASFLCAAVLCVHAGMGLGGCAASTPEEQQPETVPVVANTVADPQRAVDEIYADIDIREVTPLDEATMTDTLGFDLAAISEYYGRYSSGRYGLADVYILRPAEAEGSYDIVRDRLEQIKYDRIAAADNYDILDARKIARNAEIFQYGGYLVMLMVADLERAEEIIEQYIPSNEVLT